MLGLGPDSGSLLEFLTTRLLLYKTEAGQLVRLTQVRAPYILAITTVSYRKVYLTPPRDREVNLRAQEIAGDWESPTEREVNLWR